jgi:hypothetical protein
LQSGLSHSQVKAIITIYFYTWTIKYEKTK